MKRHIVLLVLTAAIMAATTVYGQSFPPEMAGDPLRWDGLCVETTMIYTGAHNMPWSTPDPTGVERSVGVCADGDSLQLIDQFLGRVYSLTWVEDCGCYGVWSFPAPDKIRFLAVTVTVFDGDTWTAVMREGQLVFSGHPPQFWVFDDSYPMLTAHINPRPDPPMETGECPVIGYE